MPVPHAPATHESRLTSAARVVAAAAFGLYLILLLGANGVARSGGPLTWWPLVRLPAAGGEWSAIGIVALLPVVSVAAWGLGRWGERGAQPFDWGWRRVNWPLVALALLGLANILLGCAAGACLPSLLRLLLLLAHLAWIVLYIANERPPLLWVVGGIILLQSVVAFGQFISQSDLGLALLGESTLDPAVSGTSVVMRGPVRWLRAYGLTTHPNVLAGTLVTLLLILPVLDRLDGSRRRRARQLLFAVGFAALLTTLSRWSAVCLLLGLAINVAPWLAARWRGRQVARPFAVSMLPVVGLLALLFFALYGDAVTGRAVALETPVESRSLWERDRDMAIALRLITAEPVTGVGLDGYLPAARAHDAWSGLVHNVPLLLGAELGLAGIVIWLWLVAGPVLRRGALGAYAPETGLWLGFWLLGLLYPAPHPLFELRSALLAGLAAGLLTLGSRYRNSEEV
jgi:hypothetical protein